MFDCCIFNFENRAKPIDMALNSSVFVEYVVFILFLKFQQQKELHNNVIERSASYMCQMVDEWLERKK